MLMEAGATSRMAAAGTGGGCVGGINFGLGVGVGFGLGVGVGVGDGVGVFVGVGVGATVCVGTGVAWLLAVVLVPQAVSNRVKRKQLQMMISFFALYVRRGYDAIIAFFLF